jgi:predicted nuclease with TOPRIM domain
MYDRAAGGGGTMTAGRGKREAGRGKRALGLALLVLGLTGCDRGIDAVRERLAGRSRATIDSLTAANAGLQRQMVVFERISAEKDTLLREVRDAHVLIEAVAEQLRRMDGSAGALEAVDSTTMAMGGTDSVVAAPGEVTVDAAGEIPPGPIDYRDAMLRKLESVRRRLADVEDSSRVRGERLLEAAKDNDRLRAEVEEHLRTIDGQKDLIATYLVRIAELETEVTALTDSTRKLTQANAELSQANEALADSLARLTTRANTAWYVVGTRSQLVRAGVLTEEGGILGFGKSLAPSRAMTRNVFTRIDRLRDTVIALPEAREYRIVSRHDPGLVDVEVRRSLGGTMRIRDPERFWSASGWLIIVYE